MRSPRMLEGVLFMVGVVEWVWVMGDGGESAGGC